MGKKLTTEEFIAKAKEVHGDKYDYSKTVYVKYDENITYYCPIHGRVDTQVSYSHLRGCGCPECGRNKRYESRTKKLETFISQAIDVHGDRYDYSKTIYVKGDVDILITCKLHGDFPLTPKAHLQGRGCGKCLDRYLSIPEFIFEANKIHGDKYDYSKVTTSKRTSVVQIVCKHHGSFFPTVGRHLQGTGCKTCHMERLGLSKRSNKDEFIKKAIEVHGLKYDYRKVEYLANNKYVDILCPLHGYFPQTPSVHLKGSGCPTCYHETIGFRNRLLLTKYSTIGKIVCRRIRSRFGSWIVSKTSHSKTHLVSQIVGVSNEELSTYITSQFTEGMTWDNIHIDHHIPLSFFDPTKEEGIKMAWNYRNLKPLFGKDNLSKNAKLPDNWEEHLEILKEAIKDSPPLDMQKLLEE